jgi:hypothetical protein
MSFGLTGRNLPSVRTYQEAVALYEKNEKFSQSGDWRGIWNKRDKSKQMCMDGEAVVFRYHQTDLVVWYPDYIVVKAYDSPAL